MFDNLRSGHSVFTRIMLMFIVLSFCLWGIGDIFRSSGIDRTAAKVGKVSVSMQEFQRALRGMQEQARQRMGKDYSPELMKKLGLERRALDSVINRVVIEQEAASMGLSASEDDVLELIARNPQFHDSDGHFNKDLFLAMLQANHTSEQEQVANLKTQLSTKILWETVSGDVTAPDVLAEALYRARGEKRVADLLIIPITSASKPANVSDKDLKAYYDAHQDIFMVPEYRTASYVEVKSEEVKSTIKVSDAEIQKAYEERADEFQLPERRAVEQLVFESKEEAEKAAAALASGKTMTELANTMPVTNKSKLTLGELTKAELPVAADEVFALKEGGFTKPAQSGFGWHVMHVTKIVPAGKKPLAEVKSQLEADIAAKAADDAAYKLSNNIEDALGGGQPLEQAAQKNSLNIGVVTAIDKDGNSEAGAKQTMPVYPNFLETVFATEEKNHSRMVQADNGSYYLVRVDAVKKAHPRPFEEVKGQIVEAVKNEQRDKSLQALADDIAKELKAGKAMHEVLKAKGLALQPESSGGLLSTTDVVAEGKLKGKMLPAVLVKDIFSLPVGGYTGAQALTEGGYIIAGLKQVLPAALPEKSKEADALKAIREELGQSLGKEIQFDYLQYLRRKYGVSINTSLVNYQSDLTLDE